MSRISNEDLRLYNKFDAKKVIEHLIKNEICFTIEFKEGSIYATPYDFCTVTHELCEGEYQTDDLWFISYERIFSEFVKYYFNFEWTPIKIVPETHEAWTERVDYVDHWELIHHEERPFFHF